MHAPLGCIVLGSPFLINHFDLFGLRQAWLYLCGKPYTVLAFKTPGPYKVIRHPLYVGWLIAFWATPTMTTAHLVFAVGRRSTSWLPFALKNATSSSITGKRTLIIAERCRC
jgi:protein-S-isoprenylcysteine O-methyltransferase Ste14